MKTSLDLPDDLYRRVKSKSALEGKSVREVAQALFTAYADNAYADPSHVDPSAQSSSPASQALPVEKGQSDVVEPWLRAFHDWGARVSGEHPEGGFVAQLLSDRR